MIIASIIFAASALVYGAGAVMFLKRSRLAPAPPALGFVRIHQAAGKPTLEGVLVAREPLYVLKQAAMIEGEGRTIELDGPVEVLREHVAFVQRLGTLDPTL